MSKFKFSTRVKVYQKNGGRCAYCGRAIKLEEMTIDHIVPRAAGGKNELDNLNPSCYVCNFMKSHLTVDDFIAGAQRVALRAQLSQQHSLSNTRGCVLHYKRLTDKDNPVKKYKNINFRLNNQLSC